MKGAWSTSKGAGSPFISAHARCHTRLCVIVIDVGRVVTVRMRVWYSAEESSESRLDMTDKCKVVLI